jgi:hypothetical protein
MPSLQLFVDSTALEVLKAPTRKRFQEARPLLRLLVGGFREPQQYRENARTC